MSLERAVPKGVWSDDADCVGRIIRIVPVFLYIHTSYTIWLRIFLDPDKVRNALHASIRVKLSTMQERFDPYNILRTGIRQKLPTLTGVLILHRKRIPGEPPSWLEYHFRIH